MYYVQYGVYMYLRTVFRFLNEIIIIVFAFDYPHAACVRRAMYICIGARNQLKRITTRDARIYTRTTRALYAWPRVDAFYLPPPVRIDKSRPIAASLSECREKGRARYRNPFGATLVKSRGRVSTHARRRFASNRRFVLRGDTRGTIILYRGTIIL